MNEFRQTHVTPKATWTNRLKVQHRHSNPSGYTSSKITEKPISHDARHPSIAAGGQPLLHDGGGLRLHGCEHLRELEDAPRVLRGQPVVNRIETKAVPVLPKISLDDVGGVEEEAVDVVSVEERDGDVVGAEDSGELEHAVDGGGEGI